MNKEMLQILLQYAKRMGYMKFPFMDVKASYEKGFKLYSKPRTSSWVVETPKKNVMSFDEMSILKSALIKRKKGITKLFNRFGIECLIEIGGSLSLKFQTREFYDRDFHDIDFIITTTTDDDRKKVHEIFRTLEAAGAGYFTNNYYPNTNSFILGEGFFFAGKKYPVNLIIDKTITPIIFDSVFNMVGNIIQAKMNFIKEAKKAYRKPRPKDIIDLYKIL